jgi:hypothetical protein
MDIIKKSLTALILLCVVVVAWVGISIYFQQTHIDVNPNASSYTKQINNSFDLDTLNSISDKIKANLPISPSEFLSLTQDSN